MQVVRNKLIICCFFKREFQILPMYIIVAENARSVIARQWGNEEKVITNYTVTTKRSLGVAISLRRSIMNDSSN